MPLSNLTPAGVRDAIAECDEIGREAFLHKHGYKIAKKYLLLHRGREYDSKAIAGVACGMKATEFGGGAQTVEPALRAHGFTVIHADSHWYEEELVLVLHWYLRDRQRMSQAGDPDLSSRSKTLTTLASVRGRIGTARWRAPEHIVAQLERFRDIDSSHEQGAPEPSARHQAVWNKHADKPYVRKWVVEATLLEVQASESQDPDKARYRLRTKRPKPAQPPRPKPSVEPGAMQSPYQGPRKPARRTPAAPKAEDSTAWDRANESHEGLRDSLAVWLEDKGFIIYDASTEARNRKVDYDLAADRDQLRLIIETKSMPSTGGTTAEAGRLRHGLGQLLWYRQRLWAVCGERRVAVLAVEREPEEHEAWRDVCREVGVVLIWPARFVALVDECTELSARE